ncbi:heat shock protein 23 [Tetranychus urticae]|uniref:SHSP domain-containing protein n=1 Tax=Tetranychus urticae TaxID=32264 RepID=T1KUW6_TETUR|nr:heat shock protein 23 [Tetranychus urticae]
MTCPRRVASIHIPPIMMNPFGFGMHNRNIWNQASQVFEEIQRIAEHLNQNCDSAATAACSASSSNNQTSAAAHVAGPSSASSSNGDAYEVKIDVQYFKPEEINVKLIATNTLIIEAKHEEKSDGDGFVARSFTRRYLIPDSYDTQKIESQLGLDGILTVKAPRKRLGGANGDKIIPITLTSNLSSNPVIVTQPETGSTSSITEQTAKDGNNQPISAPEKPEVSKND